MTGFQRWVCFRGLFARHSLSSYQSDNCIDLILSRIPTDSEPLPDELRTPVAIADDLLAAAITSSATADPSEQTTESDSISESNEDAPHVVSLISHCMDKLIFDFAWFLFSTQAPSTIPRQ